VTGDKPFYGYQYLLSQESGVPSGGTGDPSMLAMPPVDQFQFSYIFLTPGTYPFDFINLVAPVGTAITLDGNPLTSTCTPIGAIGGVTFCAIVHQVADGVHRISGDKKFGLVVSGFGDFASYAYLGGVGLEPKNAGCATGGPYLVEACSVPAAVPLNGTAECSDGSTPTVAWSSSSGVTFNNPASEDPTAAVPGFGTFNITMSVQCVDVPEPVECSSTITVNEKTTDCGLTCNGLPATIFVMDGIIHAPLGHRQNGQSYDGVLLGTNGDDVIAGTEGPDLIKTFGGNDTICALGGNDEIEAGPGNDWVDGGPGNDLMKGQEGDDTIYGGENDDIIEGGPGADKIDGGPGNDRIKGQEGDDIICTGDGNNIIEGGHLIVKTIYR
jgi:hypothetical protein